MSEIKVDGPEITRALGNAVLFASKDGTRPVLASVNFRSVAGELRIETTDSYALYRETLDCEGDDFQATIEVRDLAPILKVMKTCAGKVLVRLEGPQVTIEAGVSTFTVRNYDVVDWPNTDQIVNGFEHGSVETYSIGATILTKIAKVSPVCGRPTKAPTGEAPIFSMPATNLKPCTVSWPNNDRILVLTMPVRIK